MSNCSLNVCRLCMSSYILIDIFKNCDNGFPLDLKVISCINIKMQPKDKLPPFICLKCKENIIKFYEFKLKCIDTDLKLRNMLKASQIKISKNKTPLKKMVKKVKQKKSSVTPRADDDDDKVIKELESELCNIEQIEPKSENNFEKSEEKEVKIDLDDVLKEFPPANNYDNYRNYDIESWQNYDHKDNILDKDQSQKSLQPITIENYNSQAPCLKIKSKPWKNKLKPISSGYQCEQCGKVIRGQGPFKRHVLAHSGVKPFKCDICTQEFTRHSHKVIHMRAHNGIKPYICDHCGFQFTRRQDLIRHMKVHSNERKYACPSCHKFFKRTTDITAHMRSHTGARPYVCKKCNKSYISSAGLKKHLLTTACKTELKKGWAEMNNIK